MREFLGLHVSEDQDTVINKALNTTLSRTIYASFTTLIVVVSLLFGGAVFKFAFAILLEFCRYLFFPFYCGSNYA
ncbi:MAG: hypothetical protein IPH46_17380 [Bacteroidetes bacterium]|nr:hypothetical protein [Bacteroidota bacterium]